MIETAIHNYFIAYLVLALLSVAIFGWRERRRIASRDKSRFGDYLCSCSNCRLLFIVRHQISAKCPACGTQCRVSRVRKRGVG